MIRVDVKVAGHVRDLMPDGRDMYRLELDKPLTVSEIIEHRVGSNPMLFASVVVNGQRRAKDYLVEEDAEIILLSPVAGG